MPDFGYKKPMTSEQIRHYNEVKRARKEQVATLYGEGSSED